MGQDLAHPLFLCLVAGSSWEYQLQWDHTYNFFLWWLSAKELSRQLEGWLAAANISHGPARAIIAP